MDIECRKEQDAVIVKISGAINVESASKLHDIASCIKKENPKALIVNLVDVHAIDKSFVLPFIALYGWIIKNDGYIYVVNPMLEVKRVCDLAELQNVLAKLNVRLNCEKP